MIVDSSAIIAILRDEPEAPACAKAIASAKARRVSAVSYVEAAVVIDVGRDPVASRRFDDLCREAQLVIEPVTESQRPLGSFEFRRLFFVCAGQGYRRTAPVQGR